MPNARRSLASSETASSATLADLVVSGPLTPVTANGDGSWTVVPAYGPALLLTGPEQVHAYVERATHGTGPQALAPARLTLPAPVTQADEEGCGCAVAPAGTSGYGADLMQARAIDQIFGREFQVHSHARSVTVDEAAQAAVLRVHTSHGLYALHIPAVGRQFPVHRNGVRDGVVSVRRVPAASDTTVALLFGSYLRDRGAL
ncbi:hypothetical protein ACODT3_42205 [Streptomyces sp. 4.24]|uniref:hypothetical protein n=1 Tax=Streptomyces tritrimontium TaxID=3406573 RepID=UPI003BB73D96